jgi:Chitobiase/beta-hexosaminidase C-terminal domain
VKAILLATAVFFLLSVPAMGQVTFTAASCNKADVAAIINGPTHNAANGDTIIIPAGNCTWASTLSFSGIGITITGVGAGNTGTINWGAGTTNTIITVNTGASSPAIYAQAVPYGQQLTIKLLQFNPITSSTPLASAIWANGTCTASGCPNIRLSNLNFVGWTNGNQLYGGSANRISDFYGVLDHNTMDKVILANVSHASWLGVGQYGDNSFARPDTFGTAAAIYFENNLFTNNGSPEDVDAGDTFQDTGGARVVVRYNVYTGLGASASYFHGTETTGRPRGGRQMEMYNNSIGCTGNCFGVISTMRSGVGYFYGNEVNVTGSGAANTSVNMQVLRGYRGPASPWGSCDGTGPYDQNDGTVYASGAISTGGATSTITDSSKSWTANQWFSNGSPYSIHDVTQSFGDEIKSNTATTYTFVGSPLTNNNVAFTWNVPDSYQILRATVCIDQPGRSGGTLLSGGTPATGWVNEVLDPLYEWNEQVTGVYFSPGISQTKNNTNHLLPDRDWYNAASGVQTNATTPFNGTSGTGWGTLANRPTTCSVVVGYFDTGANTLYKCLTTNTWTASYTPYTYPHPLASGFPNASPPGLSPAGGTFVGQVTVTISNPSSAPVVCYTTNGSTPATDGFSGCTTGNVSSGSLIVASTINLEAVAGGSGFADSSVASGLYTITLGIAPPTDLMIIATR